MNMNETALVFCGGCFASIVSEPFHSSVPLFNFHCDLADLDLSYVVHDVHHGSCDMCGNCQTGSRFYLTGYLSE